MILFLIPVSDYMDLVDQERQNILMHPRGHDYFLFLLQHSTIQCLWVCLPELSGKASIKDLNAAFNQRL